MSCAAPCCKSSPCTPVREDKCKISSASLSWLPDDGGSDRSSTVACSCKGSPVTICSPCSLHIWGKAGHIGRCCDDTHSSLRGRNWNLAEDGPRTSWLLKQESWQSHEKANKGSAHLFALFSLYSLLLLCPPISPYLLPLT